MSKPKIALVVGSTREGRFADKPVAWFSKIAAQRDDIQLDIVDLRDFPMPHFDEPMSPAWGPSKNEVAQKWQAKVAEYDGFIFTAAEYNHAPTGVLKNALDYAYPQWVKKPAGFIGYGGVGGARAVEQLRMIAIELQMAPTKTAVHIVWADMFPVMKGEKQLEEYDHLNAAAKGMLEEFAWWAKALKKAREDDVKAGAAKAA